MRSRKPLDRCSSTSTPIFLLLPTPALACSHTIAFTLIRGSGDTRGLTGAVVPLGIVALPSLAYAAYYRAVPPQALRFGVYSAALLHVYDRILKTSHGISYDNLPTTHLHRRVF